MATAVSSFEALYVYFSEIRIANLRGWSHCPRFTNEEKTGGSTDSPGQQLSQLTPGLSGFKAVLPPQSMAAGGVGKRWSQRPMLWVQVQQGRFSDCAL